MFGGTHNGKNFNDVYVMELRKNFLREDDALIQIQEYYDSSNYASDANTAGTNKRKSWYGFTE